MPLGLLYKYGDDGGGNLAALITYFAFVSLFPLLLLASTVLGLVLRGRPELQQQLLDSALSQLPVIGAELGRPQQLGGGVLGIVVGLLGAMYGAMGVGQAVQNASNAAWTVPRNQRPNPFLARGKSVVLIAVIGADVIGTTLVTGLVRSLDVGPLAGVGAILGALAVHVGAFAFVFRFSTTHALSWQRVLPGAATAGLGWLALQQVGAAYVGRTVDGSGASNGVFAVVLGLLAFLYLISTLLVLCIELNVVLSGRLWPRTLLTPFTDNVILTDADRQSYVDQATSQTLKGFQRVEVAFDPSPAEQPGTESGARSPESE